jgi:hypothetical protein
VLTAALILWHMLLTELGTSAGPIMVGNVASALWGVRSTEPEGTGMFKSRIREENGPPQPKLAIPREAEPLPPRPELQPAYVPAGQPISYRGLLIRRQQESGLW